MKRLMYCLLFPMFTIMFVTALHAQTANPDILYLKDGGEVTGNILEIGRDHTIKIRAADSTVYIYQLADVRRVSINPLSSVHMPEQDVQIQESNGARNSVVSVYCGLSIPVGSFGKTTANGEEGDEAGGAASLGFAIGGNADIPVTPTSAALFSIDYASNSVDLAQGMAGSGISAETTSWTSLWALVGLKIFGNVSPSTELFAFGQGGLLYGSTPQITASYGGVTVIQNSASASAFGYGFGAGMRTGRFTLSARYLGGKPEYEITASVNGSDLGHATFEQQMSCVVLTAGFAF